MRARRAPVTILWFPLFHWENVSRIRMLPGVHAMLRVVVMDPRIRDTEYWRSVPDQRRQLFEAKRDSLYQIEIFYDE